GRALRRPHQERRRHAPSGVSNHWLARPSRRARAGDREQVGVVNPERAPVVLGTGPIALGRALAVAHGAPVALDDGVEPRLDQGVRLLQHLLDSGAPIYGVTTGFGSSVDTRVAPREQRDLALNLVRFHGCGTGVPFDELSTRAILVARLASLVRG